MTDPFLIAPKRTKLFGLDIGTETVKIVQLEGKRQVSLTGFAIGAIPPATLSDGVITEPEKLATAVQGLLDQPKQGKLDAPFASIALPASKTFSRVITVPKLAKKELAEAVHYEFEQSVAQPSEQLYTDYAVIGTYAEGKESRQDVLVAAVPKAIVDSYLLFLEKLGRLPHAFETELEAISRAIIASHADPKPVLVADIGAKTTDLSVVVGGSLRLTGSVGVGGEHFTAAIAAALRIDPAAAEQTKVRYGLGAADGAQQIKAALDPLIDQVTTEIRRMMRFYQDRTPAGTSVGQIVLSGGSSTLIGLREHFSESLAVQVEIGNPWQGINTGSAEPMSQLSAPIFTTAIGLALGGLPAHA